MSKTLAGLCSACLILIWPLVCIAQQTSAVQGQPLQPSVDQSSAPAQPAGSQDVFSYSYLQVNRLSEQSYAFNSLSAGNGLRFAYDFPDQVYVFGEWNSLNFDRLPGSHDLAGLGVGAHQQYNASTSFYVNLSFLRDQLSGSLGGARDYYWRLSYGFQSHLSSFVGLTAAILTERNTDFGRRPFGERLGLIFGGSMTALTVSAEHTNNGNRLEAALNWYYK